MIKKIITYSVLILIILSLIYGITYFRSEMNRFENNYNVTVNSLNNAEILNANEVKTYHYSLDSLRKELDIRRKTVTNIFVTKYNYRDSVRLIPELVINQVNDTNYIAKEYSFKSDCYDLNIYNSNDTLLHYINWHDKLTGFLYWERKHRLWFIRWGSKQYFIKLYSDCQKDTIKVEKLILID